MTANKQTKKPIKIPSHCLSGVIQVSGSPQDPNLIINDVIYTLNMWLCVCTHFRQGARYCRWLSTDSGCFPSSLKEVRVWPSAAWLRSVTNVHSSVEVTQINVWVARLKFHQQRLRACSRVWKPLISPPKKDTIMRYEIGRVNQTEANA